MTRFISLLGLSCLLSYAFVYAGNENNTEMITETPDIVAAKLIKQHENDIVPLEIEVNKIYFDAAISGDKSKYERISTIQIELSNLYANGQRFNELKKLKEAGEITSPLLKRQIDLLYNGYLMAQVDTSLINEMIVISNTIEHRFSTFRANVGDKKYSDNEVESILSTSTNSQELEQIWKASKQIGDEVAPEIIKVVKLRNKIAHSLGFSNYHVMRLALSEQNSADIEQLFDELDALTLSTYKKLKNDIDASISKKQGIAMTALMPWHYENRFFQEAPSIYEFNPDIYYKNANVVELTQSYYKGIGLPINDIISQSDLYEKPGKNQHAFCIDMDRNGDIRILCNVKQNAYWMGTMLHEFGHAVYDKYIDKSLPYVLKEPAHTFTTEAIAMLFGRLSNHPQWLDDMALVSAEEKIKIAQQSYNATKLQQLIFSRWTQVMYRFEKALYEDPDQDLNTIWWDLVERYQLMKRPPNRNQADWASKIHIATSPCYYHNYLLGELLASQLHYHITKEVIISNEYKWQSYANQPKVGAYLIEHMFKPGNRYPWNELIEKATGEKLTAKYFANQFLD